MLMHLNTLNTTIIHSNKQVEYHRSSLLKNKLIHIFLNDADSNFKCELFFFMLIGIDMTI